MDTTIATVVFLRRNNKICLARKKKPIHNENGEIAYSLKMWNGYGGKAELVDITVRHTAVREADDEALILSHIDDLIPCGKVQFFWEGNTTETADMVVSFYFLDRWEGEPKESMEMGPPCWFTSEEIPYHEMMGGDRLLLPRMIAGEYVSGRLYLGDVGADGLPRFVEEVL